MINFPVYTGKRGAHGYIKSINFTSRVTGKKGMQRVEEITFPREEHTEWLFITKW